MARGIQMRCTQHIHRHRVPALKTPGDCHFTLAAANDDSTAPLRIAYELSTQTWSTAGARLGAAGRAEHVASRYVPAPFLPHPARPRTCLPVGANNYLQCDEGKPTCQQCAKSKRECGGYRSEFEIVHRDQTKSTVRRMRKALDGQQQPPTPTSASTPTPMFPTAVFVLEQTQLQTPAPSPQEEQEQRRQQQQSPGPQPSPTVPIAQRASCFFASNFILVPSGSTPHGFMEYLVPLIETAHPDSSLSYAFNACAFAALGNRVRTDSVDFAALALKQQTNALKRTHVALGNPATANTDTTLASVLLLSLYEVRLLSC